MRVLTDHKPLKFLPSQPHLSKRQVWSMEQLAETDLQIDQLPGPDAVVLDVLSHRPDYGDYEGNLLLHTILTLEANCSTFSCGTQIFAPFELQVV